jgi:membrane protein required for colicin V production
MYWLDSTILVLLAIGALVGAWTGFLWQAARIISLALSLYAAILANDGVTRLLQDTILKGVDERIPHAIAYVVVFIVVYIILHQIVWLLDRFIRAVRLETMDRLLGALVGACKIGLILAAVCLGVTAYPHPLTKEVMEKSTLAPVLAEGMEMILLVIPEEYKSELCTGLKNLREMARALQKNHENTKARKSEKEPLGKQASSHPSPGEFSYLDDFVIEMNRKVPADLYPLPLCWFPALKSS